MGHVFTGVFYTMPSTQGLCTDPILMFMHSLLQGCSFKPSNL